MSISVSITELYKFILLGILWISPVIYVTYWEIRSSKEHKWVWTLLVVLQTFVNMWFAFLPNSYSVAFLMLSIVAWLVIGVAQKA
jgi:hypothetical protein